MSDKNTLKTMIVNAKKKKKLKENFARDAREGFAEPLRSHSIKGIIPNK